MPGCPRSTSRLRDLFGPTSAPAPAPERATPPAGPAQGQTEVEPPAHQHVEAADLWEAARVLLDLLEAWAAANQQRPRDPTLVEDVSAAALLLGLQVSEPRTRPPS